MPDLKACIVCFTMDIKLISMDNNQLRHQYNLLTGLQLQKGNGMPEHVCYQCCGYLTRFIKFRDKCHRAYFVLDQLLQKDNEIRKAALEAVINRNSSNIKPYLSYFNGDVAVLYEKHDIKEMKNNQCMNSIHVMSPSTLTKAQMFEDVANEILIKQENESVIDVKSNMTEIDMSVVFNSDNDKEMNAQYSSFNGDKTEVCDENNKDNCLDIDDNANMSRPVKTKEQLLDKSQEADGSVIETEYATMHAMSRNEAQAALAILKTIGLGKHICNVCERLFKTEDRLKEHLPVHDRLTANGRYFCDLCTYYYKSSFLLKTHMTEKHMYKYVCKKCPEVCFERMTAKQHYSRSHLRKNNDEPWELVRPSWLLAKGGRRKKGVPAAKPKLPKRKRSKLPADIVYTPVSQEEQYARIQDRKQSRSYIESPYKCHLCFKGCMDIDTYCKHMRKHDPAISGDLQCDMCKLYFKKNLQIYYHMKQTHMNKFSCRLCDYACYHRGQALLHYKTHKNVTYKCPFCPLEFKHLMTRQTHLRRNHPSSFICNLCGHNFVSETGLSCHKQISHTAEEIEASSQAPVDKTNALYCADCGIFFISDAAFTTHLGSSKNHGRPAGATAVIRCKISQCNKFFASKKQGIEHYSTEHPGHEYPKPHMCDVCGFSTRQYTNLVAHKRTHTNEKPFKCPQCDRRFTQVSSRDRHMVVHTGEKRYQCHLCPRRFKQSNGVKLHIQTVHMKIPYAPWDKKNRKRRQELKKLQSQSPLSTSPTEVVI